MVGTGISTMMPTIAVGAFLPLRHWSTFPVSRRMVQPMPLPAAPSASGPRDPPKTNPLAANNCASPPCNDWWYWRPLQPRRTVIAGWSIPPFPPPEYGILLPGMRSR